MVVILAAMSGLAGCASTSSATPGARVVVVEHDFGLVASRSSVPAGTVTFEIENRGPSTHELNVDETSAAAGSLPLQQDDLQVNEDSPRLHNVGSLGDIRVYSSHDLTLHLKRGHYVLFCNLEGHYLGGMHVALNVT